jgi:hypothetical protein
MNSGAFAVVRSVAAVWVSAVILAGCSGVRPYPDNLDKNLVIQTETDSGSIFSKVTAAVDIYSVSTSCETEYRGTVDLDKPTVAVGIPPDKLSYVVFVFSNASFLGSSKSTISHEALLRARAGYRYDIRVSYNDDMYNVAIDEQDPKNPRGRKIAVRDISTCKAL